MNTRNLVRTLAVAALLAMTVVSVSAQHADAKPRREKQTHGPVVIDPIGQPRNVVCGIQGYVVGQLQHDWVFYLPGEEIEVNGQRYECFRDGTWGLAIVIQGNGGVHTQP